MSLSQYRSESWMLFFETAEEKSNSFGSCCINLFYTQGLPRSRFYPGVSTLSGFTAGFYMPTKKVALFQICTHASGSFFPSSGRVLRHTFYSWWSLSWFSCKSVVKLAHVLVWQMIFLFRKYYLSHKISSAWGWAGFCVGVKRVKEQEPVCVPASLGSSSSIRILCHDSECHLSLTVNQNNEQYTSNSYLTNGLLITAFGSSNWFWLSLLIWFLCCFW